MKRDAFNAVLIQQTADITGVSDRHVRRVINGAYENEGVTTVYMELLEGNNKLLQAVKSLVPFEGHKPVELEVKYRSYDDSSTTMNGANATEA